MVPAETNEGGGGGGFRLHLWLAAAWAGAAVMAFELLGARLLMPAFGMGIEVWAAVIATTLGSLAIGYWLGGRLADARPSAVALGWVLVLASGSLLLVQAVGREAIARFAGMPFVAGAWSSAATSLAMPLVLLGMIQPMAARQMIQRTDRAGSVVGTLMAASTLGGVAGTAVTGLVLIPQVGISKSLLLLAYTTGATGMITLAAARRFKQAALVLVLAAAILGVRQLGASSHRPRESRLIEEVEGRYGHLELVDLQGAAVLLCDGIFQTVLPVSGLGLTRGMLIRGHDYVELVPWFRPGTRTALLLGLGGGMHQQAMALYGIATHAVEIEPAVVDLATRHFGVVGDVTVADARAFLVRDHRQFDAIVLDAFLGSSVPEHLYTREAFELMAARLSPDGVLVLHMVSRPRHAATRAVAATLRAVFTNVTAARSGWANELQHVYIFASRQPLELTPEDRLELNGLGFTGQELWEIDAHGQAPLTDDRSGLALLGRELVTEHRLQSLERRRQSSW